MAKVTVFLLLLMLAAGAAGVFGAIHNQFSYSVGPEYFHKLKFQQFRIPQDLHNRLGAALVGWRASWWMGPLVGLPAFLLGLFLLPAMPQGLRTGLRAIGSVLLLTAAASGLGLVFGMLAIDIKVANQIPVPSGVKDSAAFLRAGVMHDASYFGGLAGMLLAVWLVIRERRRGL